MKNDFKIVFVWCTQNVMPSKFIAFERATKLDYASAELIFRRSIFVRFLAGFAPFLLSSSFAIINDAAATPKVMNILNLEFVFFTAKNGKCVCLALELFMAFHFAHFAKK